MDLSSILVHEQSHKLVAVECTSIGFPRGLPEEELRMIVVEELDKLVRKVKDIVKMCLDGILLIVCLDNIGLTIESWEYVVFEYLNERSHYGIRDILMCEKDNHVDLKDIIKYAKNKNVCRFSGVITNLENYDYDSNFKESLMKEILLRLSDEHDLTDEDMLLLLKNCTNLEEVLTVLSQKVT
ncbi:uncharacterized protein RNJ42_01689 [Nakaseomyces bracarensis]|uniref:uncharacterized protein n=1 Tax=Nakaseomyces bracarensis TaxID=273131 RepID=UPI0038720D7D